MDISFQNLGNLMKEAQKMQQRMQEAQEQLSKLTVMGQAGTGSVKVEIEMNGRHEVLKTIIAPGLMEEDRRNAGKASVLPQQSTMPHEK